MSPSIFLGVDLDKTKIYNEKKAIRQLIDFSHDINVHYYIMFYKWLLRIFICFWHLWLGLHLFPNTIQQLARWEHERERLRKMWLVYNNTALIHYRYVILIDTPGSLLIIFIRDLDSEILNYRLVEKFSTCSSILFPLDHKTSAELSWHTKRKSRYGALYKALQMSSVLMTERWL